SSPEVFDGDTRITVTSENDEELYLEADQVGVTQISEILEPESQIADGLVDGQRLTLIGTSDDKVIEIVNDVNIKLNGIWRSSLDGFLELRWNGTFWVEQNRK